MKGRIDSMRHFFNPRAIWLSGLTVVAAFAGIAVAADSAVTVQDANRREVRITDSSRIISIGGSVTEILYALGLEDRIIAVDTSSVYPPQALKEKPNVGYMRQLSPEGVLGLGPSLVLATDGAGPKQAMTVLETASVPLVLIPDRFTGESIVERIRLIAAATGMTARGECLAKKVESEFARVADLRKTVQKPLRVVFVLTLTNGKPMVAGQNTAADGVIKLAGGQNVFSDFEGYKAVSDEAIVSAQPDIVLSIRRGDTQLTSEEIFAHPAFSLTPAAKSRNHISMDSLYLLGFGPRTGRAIGDLAGKLYPSLANTNVAENSGSADCCE
jgi:iron complex transport system substrate-binding protein